MAHKILVVGTIVGQSQMAVRGLHPGERKSFLRHPGTLGAPGETLLAENVSHIRCGARWMRSRGPQFPISGLERQRHPGRWADGHRDPRRVWIRSNTSTIRITTDRNHTNRALAEGGTILEIRRDLADFSNCCLRVVHESNHNLFFRSLISRTSKWSMQLVARRAEQLGIGP